MLSTTTKVSARASRQTPSFERLLGGSLGAPWGSLGVLGGSLGAPRRLSGHPGATLTIRVLTLEGLRGGLGRSKITLGAFFRDPRRSNVCISKVLSMFTLWT